MKKIIVFALAILIGLNVTAQKLNPVKWNFEAVKKSDKQYDIVFTANVDAPWHIYSQFVKKGPVPTKITLKKNPLVQVNGKTKELGKLEKNFDKNFGAEIAYFSKKVQFVQSVTLKVAMMKDVYRQRKCLLILPYNSMHVEYNVRLKNRF
jgi:thiol:disulfide interchange protein DsbD